VHICICWRAQYWSWILPHFYLLKGLTLFMNTAIWVVHICTCWRTKTLFMNTVTWVVNICSCCRDQHCLWTLSHESCTTVPVEGINNVYEYCHVSSAYLYPVEGVNTVYEYCHMSCEHMNLLKGSSTRFMNTATWAVNICTCWRAQNTVYEYCHMSCEHLYLLKDPKHCLWILSHELWISVPVEGPKTLFLNTVTWVVNISVPVEGPKTLFMNTITWVCTSVPVEGHKILLTHEL
jgi:hypothetical protein